MDACLVRMLAHDHNQSLHSYPSIWVLSSYGSLFVGGLKSAFKKKTGSMEGPAKVHNKTTKAASISKQPRGSFSFVGGMQVPIPTFFSFLNIYFYIVFCFYVVHFYIIATRPTVSLEIHSTVNRLPCTKESSMMLCPILNSLKIMMHDPLYYPVEFNSSLSIISCCIVSNTDFGKGFK